MNQPIKKILVVGGGTAGWLSALTLHQGLNFRGGKYQQLCEITLIESPHIPTVGVGEATIPTLRDSLGFLGFDEREWMLKCNATFKLAIHFKNWTGREDYPHYWHPFGGAMPVFEGISFYHYLYQQDRNKNADLNYFNYDAYIPEILSAIGKKSPKFGTEGNFKSKLPYAYHLDAGLFAQYLQEKGTQRGVNHVLDDVVNVKLNEQGFISHIETKEHGNLEADLFIDCTGFKGLLINQALGECFDSYNDSLFCDRAIAIQTKKAPDETEINSYTSATALNSGWAWHTPLFNRDGNGYVYSSHFTTPDEAEAEFRTFLGAKANDATARHLKMRIGKTSRSWVKNCISVGLSNGFIEPLESTGIYLIEIAIKWLLNNFPDQGFDAPLVQKYNNLMTAVYEEIRDFIVLHYCLTKREDTEFWKANQLKNHPAIPDSLQARLAFYQYRLPNFLPNENQGILFKDQSYLAIIAGMGYLPQKYLPKLDYLTETETQRFHQASLQMAQNAQKVSQTLPNHYQYLQQLRQPQPVPPKVVPKPQPAQTLINFNSTPSQPPVLFPNPFFLLSPKP